MQHLKDLVEKAKSAIEQIENRSLATLDEIRVEYFGKKGHFTQLMQELRNVAAEERPAMGAKINEAKQAALDFLNAKKAEWEQAELNAKLEKERIDVSLPGRKTETGGLHPVTITINRVTKFFSELGFSVETGPEIESDYYNFDALNIPKHHPARADHDTFWFNPELLHKPLVCKFVPWKKCSRLFVLWRQVVCIVMTTIKHTHQCSIRLNCFM